MIPFKGATSITPNLPEAKAIISRLTQTSSNDYITLAKQIREDLEMDFGIITLGENGAAITDGVISRHIPAIKSDVFDVTGAGDTFISVFTYFITSRTDPFKAVEYSIQAASQVVGQLGTAVPDLSRICTTLLENKICKINDLLPLIALLKRQGKKIGFTNGCFDILHAGHVSYLKEAKSFCDLLIVGINNDASVKRLKGKLRPINNLEERQTVLSELNCVSKVISFHEDTPEKLISAIKPHILFKGAIMKDRRLLGLNIQGKQY